MVQAARLAYAFAVAFLLVFVSHAMYLQITAPVSATLHQNSSIYLGKVGPGESFYIEASASTTNASGVIVTPGWDTFEAVSLPAGWSSQPTALYSNPMKLKITVAPYAANGTYKLVLRAVNIENYSKLGNLTINAYINVTPNIFKISAEPLVLHSGINQPVDVHIVINNSGDSDDLFDVYASGLPAFNNTYSIIVKRNSTTELEYAIFEDEPGVYPFNLTVGSIASPMIHKSFVGKLIIQQSVLNDYSATGQGVLISPIIYEPAYAFMLLLKTLSKYL